MNILQTRSDLLLGKTIFDMNLNVGYYARVSTDKNDQLNSLENQSNYFREMIDENKNWHLVGEYIDEGISGTSVKNRENFLKMIEDAKQGKLDLIVTKEISRFSRNVVDSIKYTEELLRHGTAVFFISDNINTLYPDSEFRLTLMSSLAQDEVRKLSERVKFGIKRMIKEGKIIGGNLTGYYKKDGKMIINEEERPIIEILFNLYATGKYSFESISDFLFEKGYQNKNGNPYSGTTLKKLLINPRFKGYYTANLSRVESYKTHKKIPIPKEKQIIYKTDLIEPIVSEELWNKANDLYQKRYHKRKLNITTSQKNIEKGKYTNKLFCHEHNTVFIRCAGSNRKSNPTWVCKKYKEEGILSCHSPIIRERILDDFISNLLEGFVRNNIQLDKNEMISLYQEVFFKVNNQVKISRQKELEELNVRRDKLINLNIANIISNEELNTKLNRNTIEINKLMNEIDNRKDKKDNDKRLKDIELEIDRITDIYHHLNIYVNLLIDKIVVTKLNTRYQMNFKIYFNDGSIKKVYYEN